MRRRPFLAAAAASTTLAGCLADDDSPSPGESGTDGTTSDGGGGDDGTGTTDSTDENGTADDVDAAFAVEDVVVKTFAYALRLNDLGGSPGAEPTDVADLSERERAVVEAAIDGSYEREDVPDWLAAFADVTRHVSIDGDVYRLDFALPTYTITANETDAASVDGEIAGDEAYREAVTHDGIVMSGLVRIAARDGITFYSLWPDLQAFLEEYEAVAYHGSVYELSVEVADPGAPYSVSASSVSIAELADGPVVRADEQSAAVREHLVAAAETQGLYAFEDAPDDLFSVVREHRYVYHDGRFYAAYVEKDGSVPLEVFAAPAGPADGSDATPAGVPTLEVGLENAGNASLNVMSGAPEPLGVLTYDPVDGSAAGDGGVLWTDAYAESDHVHTEDGSVQAVNAIGLVTNYPPGERRSDRYAVHGDPASSEYRVADAISVTSGDDEEQRLPYEVRFAVSRD